MSQEAVRRLCNPSESCHVRKVASLLAQALIHPSDPWPLAGHPEAMKKSYRRDYFHTSAWKVNSPKLDFRFTEFYEVGALDVLFARYSPTKSPEAASVAACTRHSPAGATDIGDRASNSQV